MLDVSQATAEALARLLPEHRERLGTRKGTRVLEPFKQSVLILRWFLDGTRLTQLARDNRISVPTAYRYLHEELTVLGDHAPGLLARAAAADTSARPAPGTTPPAPAPGGSCIHTADSSTSSKVPSRRHSSGSAFCTHRVLSPGYWLRAAYRSSRTGSAATSYPRRASAAASRPVLARAPAPAFNTEPKPAAADAAPGRACH
ncbi:hypothetical protein ACWCQK_26165 [Streptomyces sp. NPDC002306]